MNSFAAMDMVEGFCWVGFSHGIRGIYPGNFIITNRFFWVNFRREWDSSGFCYVWDKPMVDYLGLAGIGSIAWSYQFHVLKHNPSKASLLLGSRLLQPSKHVKASNTTSRISTLWSSNILWLTREGTILFLLFFMSFFYILFYRIPISKLK